MIAKLSGQKLSAFKLSGMGGGGGNAVAADLRLNKTATTDLGDIVGSLDLSNLIPGNVKRTVNIGGVIGTLTGIEPGDDIFAAANTSRTNASLAYTKMKSITLRAPATYRIYFELRGAGVGNTSYGRIYKNGVPLGIERTQGTDTNTWVAFVEDLTFNTGDTVELWTRVQNNIVPGAVMNFQVRIIGVPIVTLD